MSITYLTGDATTPTKLPALIPHVCNDQGGWGRGFVLALSARWPEPERAYRAMLRYQLGTAHYVRVTPDILVANLIAQHGTAPAADGTPPIRYDALARALTNLAHYLTNNPRYTVHAPRLGAGLAGGDWPRIAALLTQHLPATTDIYVYDLPTTTPKTSRSPRKLLKVNK